MRKYLAVDYEFCTGCHTCRWQYVFVPVPTDRCDRCARRQAAGKAPTCVQHCQAGCLYCGTLEELAEKIDLGKKKLALFS